MAEPVYRNAADAFCGQLSRIMSKGSLVDPRGRVTRELVGESFTIYAPLERFIIVPHRENNPFATVAESVWVLSGRNDIGFLLPYLHRAAQFSDDGTTWRAAYGPRLRGWNGVDQIRAVVDLLTEDPSTRRGVMAIFDPDQDFAESKDIPCNNWLHWMVRDGSLDLSVAVRSSDIVWGFSGINTFEWSMLQECMAHWLGVAVGRQHWLVSSMHVYERHWKKAEKILASWASYSGIYASARRRVAFGTELDQFDAVLHKWFELEDQVRTDPRAVTDVMLSECADPLLHAFLVMLQAYWLAESGRDLGSALRALAPLEGTDIHAAATFWLRDHHASEQAAEQSAGIPLIGDAWSFGLNASIAELHSEKDAAYQDSWKKRGELISILANIARKIDRLSNLLAGAPEGAEPLYETAVDAFVYCLKYRTYLLDQDAALRQRELGMEWLGSSASDGTAGFDTLLALYQLPLPTRTVSDVCGDLVLSLSVAEALASDGAALGERFEMATRLSELAYELTALCASPDLLAVQKS
jgi:thymidylate synthase